MKNLLQPDIQAFIRDNTAADTGKLALMKNPFPGIDWKEILGQIAARAKAKDKLPGWFNTDNIIWPSKISVEQTSSEATAEYKSRIVAGKSLIDLTGGLGVDAFYFAKKMESVVHCEIDAELSEIAAHNFKQLGAANIECLSGESARTLEQLDRRFDWIFIDPSRRNDAKGKVFLLKDCLPDVPGNLDLYFSYSNHILIKTSPMLDISVGLDEMRHVKTIHVVALRGEVKELLWELENGYRGKTEIKTVDISKDGEQFFSFASGDAADVTYSLPATYLYEPNAAVMKSGGFDEIASRFPVGKLHRHSHLYTSDEKIEGFPGRSFEIKRTFAYHKASMKEIAQSKANVTVRNFPEDVETIRKKWKLLDGGDVFYFFTTNMNNEKIVLICAKI